MSLLINLIVKISSGSATLFLALFLSISSISFTQVVTDNSEYGELIFKSGFEGSSQVSDHPTSIKRQIMTGVDGDYSWENLVNQFDKAEFFYLTGTNNPHGPYAEASISNNIGYNNSRGIVLETKEDDPSDTEQTRVEYWMYPDYKNNGFFSTQGFIRYKMKLDENLNDAVWPSHWINFFETKQGLYPNRNYRFSTQIRKHIGDTKAEWVFVRNNEQSGERFELVNEDVPVPIDQWMYIEIFWKKHGTNGRLFLKVNDQIVFDFVGQTQHPTNPQHTDFVSPLKNYRSREWHEGSRTSKIWYDDLELWTGFPNANDEILSFEAPENVVAGETYPVKVTIKSESNRTVQLRLQNTAENFKSYGSLNFNITQGTNTYTRNITVADEAPRASTFQWLAAVLPVNGTWDNRIDNVNIKDVACTKYEIQDYTAPTSVVPGETYTLSVPYIGKGAANIRTILQNKDDSFATEGSVTATINGSGTTTLNVTVNNDASLGNNYSWQTYISPVDGDWSNRYANQQVDGVSCTATSNVLSNITSSYWRLENKATGMWVRPQGCNNDSGTNLVVVPATYTGNCTMFQFVEASNDHYFIINKATNGRIKFQNNAKQANDTVPVELVSDAYTGNNPQWKLIDAGDGYYRIQNRTTGNWIRSKGCSAVENTLITQVSTAYTGDCTLWKLVDAGSINANKNVTDISNQSADVIIFPNPINDVFTLKINTLVEEVQYVRLYNLQGKLIKEVPSNELEAFTETLINVSELANGVYILSIKLFNKPIQNFKIIVKN